MTRRDIVSVARALWSRPGSWRWNPAADLNGDGKVNIYDLKIVLLAVKHRDCGNTEV